MPRNFNSLSMRPHTRASSACKSLILLDPGVCGLSPPYPLYAPRPLGVGRGRRGLARDSPLWRVEQEQARQKHITELLKECNSHE
jgi:hypothetical protein